MCRRQYTWAKKPFLERRAYRNRFHIRATNCCLRRLQPVTLYEPLPSVHFSQSVSLHSSEVTDKTLLIWCSYANVSLVSVKVADKGGRSHSDWEGVVYLHLHQTRCRHCLPPLKVSDSSDGLLPQRHESSSASEQEVCRLSTESHHL